MAAHGPAGRFAACARRRIRGTGSNARLNARDPRGRIGAVARRRPFPERSPRSHQPDRQRRCDRRGGAMEGCAREEHGAGNARWSWRYGHRSVRAGRAGNDGTLRPALNDPVSLNGRSHPVRRV
ncbi:hypothetical protein BG61_07585 [Caballeronia glathei]|uniref:Uncharacterized protein n=1 Tax=Caballeronia glathei TaxID=60547 RepID=A0A069PPU2_9BURK|nr:hypothetical protein BG61_07585 [Caballeronia glathei]